MFSEGYNSNWGQFASTKWIAEGKGCPNTVYISLEYIHNNIHNLTGGSDYATGMGHMSDVPVAAFDPIFWLHHVQIDLLLAIWQCLNPKLWFDNGQSGDSDTAGATASSVTDDKETDPLEPFHKKENDPEKEVWTAQACRDWTELNYQYDDLAEVAERTIRKYGRFISGSFNESFDHISTRSTLVQGISLNRWKRPVTLPTAYDLVSTRMDYGKITSSTWCMTDTP
ncbi:hypothetical protein BFJ71_g6299 [Fusarium oxysporum]|nr:hypothetical protein BFJ71_g6299 [Fusarium oxysporum]